MPSPHLDLRAALLLLLLSGALALGSGCSDDDPGNATNATPMNNAPADAGNNVNNANNTSDVDPPDDASMVEDTSDVHPTDADIAVDTSDVEEDTVDDTLDVIEDAPADVEGDLADVGAGPAANPRVIFVFDQDLDALFRFEDRDGDGDMDDPGDVTRFFDDSDPVTGISNSQGMFALGPNTLLATDNFEPANIIRLEDKNGDGDALDDDESSVWFDGALPGGLTMRFPVNLTKGPDGAFYVVDNNTLDTTNPEALYRLEDTDADGSISPGEVTRVATFSEAGVDSTATIFDVELDAAGRAYVINTQTDDDIDRLMRVDGEQVTEFLGGDTLFVLTEFGQGLVLSTGGSELTRLPQSDELVLLTADLGRNYHFIAVRDVDDSGRIDLAREIRVLWDAEEDLAGVGLGKPSDYLVSADGSLVWTDAFSDQIVQAIDHDLDGDFGDEGEITIVYSADVAEAAGVEVMRAGRAMTVFLRD